MEFKFHPSGLSLFRSLNFERQKLRKSSPWELVVLNHLKKGFPASPTDSLELILSCRTGNEIISLVNDLNISGS